MVSFVGLWKWRRKIRVKGAILKHRSLIFSCSGETGSGSDALEAKSLEFPTNSAAVFAGKLRPGSIAVSWRLLIRKIRIFKHSASPGEEEIEFFLLHLVTDFAVSRDWFGMWRRT